MKQNSFRSFPKNNPETLSGEQKQLMEHLSHLVQPYANWSEEEIRAKLRGLSRDPTVAAYLTPESMSRISRQLSPYLSADQQSKLARLLRDLKS